MCLRLAEHFDLGQFAYAHRGLWRPDGPSENSLDAFLLAAEHGLGIEFDVRPSSDGVPVIFHDPTLDRMTSKLGCVEDHTCRALLDVQLDGGGRIIALTELLDAWPATTPLLCELKIDGATEPGRFAETVANQLQTHKGPVAAMSFSTDAVAALPSDLMRGQLILPSELSGQSDLAATPTAHVDYLACHTADAENASLQAARSSLPLICWTTKNAAECAALASLTDSQIFEGFDPALAKQHILNR